MKSRLLFLSALGLFLVPLAHATVTFDMALDRLVNSVNTPVPDGMAVFLIADTTNNGFAAPSAGSFSTGSIWGNSTDDIILWASATNGSFLTGSAGSQDNLSSPIDYAGFAGLNAGDHLEVVWLPTTAYSATTVIGSSATYGYFGYGSVGDDNTSWIAPSDPSSGYGLDFFTAGGTTFGTGNDMAAFGAVPEPSTFALLGGALALGLAARRRKTAKVA